MSNRPIHPTENSTAVAGNWLTDAAQVVYPATVEPVSETMRPRATDYQPLSQGTTAHGYDNDIPTDKWEPDQDYSSQLQKQDAIPAPPLFPAIDVRILPDGLVRTTMRIGMPANVPYVGVIGSVDITTVRQLVSRNLFRRTMIFKCGSAPLVTGFTAAAQFQFAISATKSFDDYMTMGSPTDIGPLELHGTDELWIAVLPLVAYNSTILNTFNLNVIEEVVVTPDMPETLGK